MTAVSPLFDSCGEAREQGTPVLIALANRGDDEGSEARSLGENRGAEVGACRSLIQGPYEGWFHPGPLAAQVHIEISRFPSEFDETGGTCYTQWL